MCVCSEPDGDGGVDKGESGSKGMEKSRRGTVLEVARLYKMTEVDGMNLRLTQDRPRDREACGKDNETSQRMVVERSRTQGS